MKKNLIICLTIGISIGLAIHDLRAQEHRESITVYNKGVSGNNTADLLARLEADVLTMPKGMVIMMVGTNDMINSAKLLDMDLFRDNYQLLVDRILKKHRLILMTLPPFYEPYLLSRHPRSAYGDEGPKNRVLEANRIIRSIAEKSKCPLIDIDLLLKAMGGAGKEPMSLFRNELNSGANDGVHPNQTGYGAIAVLTYQYLTTKDRVAGSIICFGDSITYGLGVEGRGTIYGLTYPAVLSKLLNDYTSK